MSPKISMIALSLTLMEKCYLKLLPSPTTWTGFTELYQKIESVMEDVSKVKVGLEATGHYSYNLLGYLIDKGLPTYAINPLHTNLYRKSLKP